MQIRTDGITLLTGGGIVQYFGALAPAAGSVCLLLHGWTGNEHSMDTFAILLPDESAAFAPRAPLALDEGGYGWVDFRPRRPLFDDFAKVGSALWEKFLGWQKEYHLTHLPVTVMGFSQGAAMALTLTVLFANQINKTAALAGFLPYEAQNALAGKNLKSNKLFFAHGTQDEIVTIDRSIDSARIFETSGADVQFCQDEVGHRISLNCYKSLERFLKDNPA